MDKLLDATGGNKASGKRKYYAVIQLDDGNTCGLFMRFDKTDSAQNSLTSKCRVDNYLHYKNQDDLLYSGAEYTIYEESREKGKSMLKEVGKIVLE